MTSVSPRWTVDVQRFLPPSIYPDLRFFVPFFATSIEAIADELFAMPEANVATDGAMVVVDASARTARRVGFIRGQMVRQPVVVRGGLVFWSGKLDTVLLMAGHDAVPVDPHLVDAARCGSNIVATYSSGIRVHLVQLGGNGRIGQDLAIDEDSRIARCSPDGKVLYHMTPGGALRRCENAACETIAKDVYAYSLSPDGHTFAVLTARNPSLVLGLLQSSGVWTAPEILETANACSPVWASDARLWVSVRRGRSNVWTELARPTGTPTGRTSPGQSDCTDGEPDPAAPVTPDLRLVRRTRAQLRFLPGLNQLRAAWGHRHE